MKSNLDEKLRCKADLHDYMSLRLNCFLPEKRLTKLSFLQDILSEQKQVYTKDQVKSRIISKNYDEFAVKNVYDLVKNSKALQEYLPTSEMNEGVGPLREFFWGVAYQVFRLLSKYQLREMKLFKEMKKV